MKKILFLLVILFSLSCLSQTMKGRVVGVKDGDTFEVLLEKKEKKVKGVKATKETIVVRLAGVDCPEKSQDYETAAKQFASDFCFGKMVNLYKVSRDRYGRYVCWVKINRKDLSKELLKNGLAWHYKEYDGSQSLQRLEDIARKKKIGLWSKENPIKPSQFRKK